ncbi:hypothetical protein Pint_02031 [Pistacia integerrima]|uniref:Uncharacterized protein n=1 Tax=Pistacia integerrima TaxID=434235 RepID=A0ACC0ZH16_9ROSI|nr:hypothetical protein Pint_02031 [Pistacia integerrima]
MSGTFIFNGIDHKSQLLILFPFDEMRWSGQSSAILQLFRSFMTFYRLRHSLLCSLGSRGV